MSDAYHNILIRMPNWLGDAVMATPIIKDIRDKWPKANITALCQGKAIGALLVGNPYLNEIFTFSRPNIFLYREQQRDLIARIIQGRYDLGVVLPNSFSSAWWLWRGKVRRRIGFSSLTREFLLTDPILVPREKGKEHQVITYKRLLLPLGISLSSTAPALYTTQEEKDAAKELLAQYRIPPNTTLIGINAHAAYGSAKCWPKERFRALIEKLSTRANTYIICFADEIGASLVHELCANLPPNVIDLADNTTIRELIALIEQCALFLSNDSGPMHIAAALKVPLVALFGSTNPIATGPYKHGQVIHKQVECSPCYKRTCPIDFRCMRRIEIDEVYNAIIQQLETHQGCGTRSHNHGPQLR